MSRIPRFFISPGQVTGPEITISGEDARHIGAVLRMKTGDQLILCDGHGTEYSVKIAAVGRGAIRTEIVARNRREAEGPGIVLAQGLPKADKMDWIVQKATELGVTSIFPVITERTVAKPRDGEKRTSRWQRIAKEAAMQSNRPDIPEVEAIRTLGDFLRTLNPGAGSLLLLPWEEAARPIKEVLRAHAGMRTILVLIGPEGGFSRAEADLATEKGFHPVSLGPYILRTETAAVATLSMIGYEHLG